MKKILGLDLGSGSIGWSVVHHSTDRDELKIADIGVRIVPIDGGTLSGFNRGQQVTINADRTAKRTARKTYDRYTIRRRLLLDFFKSRGVEIPREMMAMERNALWQLRARAASEEVSAQELARVLYLINQKRGYKASKADLDPENKALGDYVKAVKTRYEMLHDSGLTVGQWAAENIAANPEFRVKDEIFPRAAYIEEFDRIMEVQKPFHPSLLTDEAIKELRNRIIFYQRPLKSCKHLVAPCEFEQMEVTDANGRTIKVGPKVAQRSNPLFQLSRLWQAVNNIVLTNHLNERKELDSRQKQLLIYHLLEHDKLSVSTFNKLVFQKTRQSVWSVGNALGNGIKGDKTRISIAKALGGKRFYVDVDGRRTDIMEFKPTVIETVDEATGAVVRVIDPSVVNIPYYRLWHAIYSISDKEDLKRTLRSQFGIDDEEVLENLSNLDLVKEGYGNMSIKAIRRILPYLMDGHMYSEACEMAGFRHSESLTTEENEKRELADRITPLRKGELRQPIVEKVLNQMVNIVNALMEKHGRFDEIVVEMARELRSGREERAETTKRINENEKINKETSDRIREYGLTPTRSRITKYRLWEESDMRCIYCGSTVNLTDFLKGYDVEVEHIIPRSVLFDDSFSNKACACRSCNHEKGNMTARDFMHSRGESAFHDYVERVNELKTKKKISNTKFNHLMWSSEDLPDDFINRQLNESQYIARKAVEILRSVCRTVRTTTGSVTDYLRHVWGWDQILHTLNLPTYRLGDMTEMVEVEHRGHTDRRERITGWTKRLDHRHHAVDALTIACTTQGLIQQLNSLNSLKDKYFAPFIDQNRKHKDKQTLLEQYALSLPHFTTEEALAAIDSILVSMKPVTKLVTPGKHYIKRGGKRKLVQTGLSVPRGKLHDETIFGRISVPDKKKGTRPEVVVKYSISSITSEKDARSIIDEHIRNLVIERLREHGGNAKNAFATPLYSDKARTKEIRSVRCFTGNTNVVPVKYNDEGAPIGFANPGNNYHIAIYEDQQGELHEHVATFFHCVERRRHGIPAIIKDPQAVWDDIFQRKEEFDQDFLALLPDVRWKFRFSMQRNEMFVLGMTDEELEQAYQTNDRSAISRCLYRVQSLSSNYYNFVRHTITDISQMARMANRPDKRFVRVSSQRTLLSLNPHKIIITPLGEIVRI